MSTHLITNTGDLVGSFDNEGSTTMGSYVVKDATPMVRKFDSQDEGKHVVTADGDTVGTVDEIRGSTAHIRMDEDLSRSLRRRLGWTEDDEEMYELEHANVDRITNDQIQLKKNI